MKATTGIFLDKRRKLKDETYPVKLRVTFDRKSRLYKTKYSFTDEDFGKIMSKSPKGDFKDYRLEINDVESQAAKILKEMETFSFDDFDKRYRQRNIDVSNLFDVYKVKMTELKEEDRFGTLHTYEFSLKSFKDFYPSKSLKTHELTIKFLKDYEKWMLAKGRSLTSVGIYLRCLRAIYNLALENSNQPNPISPFGKKKYQIPEPRNIKKALTINEIKRLYFYPAKDNSQEEFYRDLWFFSYLCNGMNLKDICLLQNKDIHKNHLYFYRSKTINSNRSSKPIEVALIDEIKEIINKWGTSSNDPESYVFHFVNHKMDSKKIMATIGQASKMTNKYINRVAKEVGIDKNITTYWARHSFATVLLRSNVGSEFIKEQLGHKSLKTTENYLDSFEDETKFKIANKLLEF